MTVPLVTSLIAAGTIGFLIGWFGFYFCQREGMKVADKYR